MDFIIENWYLLFAAAAVLAAAVIAIIYFVKRPLPEQLNKVREWLLWAVTVAEKELGGGTGQLKLRQVYDLFVVRFPWLARIVPFSVFEGLVDDALVEMRKMLSTNIAVKSIVKGDGNGN